MVKWWLRALFVIAVAAVALPAGGCGVGDGDGEAIVHNGPSEPSEPAVDPQAIRSFDFANTAWYTGLAEEGRKIELVDGEANEGDDPSMGMS